MSTRSASCSGRWRDVAYHDLGPDYYQRPDTLERRKQRLLTQLEGLGVDITPLKAA